MLKDATTRTQSLSEFQANGKETLDRLNATGEVEVLTVDGQTQAVLLPAAVYAELASEVEQASHLARLRKGIEQMRQGEFITLEEMSKSIRAKLLKMKTERESGT